MSKEISIVKPPTERIVADYAGGRNGNENQINLIPDLPEIDYGLGHSPFGAASEVFDRLFSPELKDQAEIIKLIQEYPTDAWSDKLSNMIRDRFNLTQDVHVSWQPGGSYRILANIIASFVDWTPEREAGVLTTGLAFPNIAKLTSQFAHRNNGDFPFASLQYPLDWNYQDRLLALAEHREQGKNSQVIFVDLPNNPTGDYPNIETMIRLAEATSRKDKPDLLIIDEAYADAAQITCAQLTEQFPHIIVLKGISKGIGLAGIRAGYAIVSKGELSKSYKDNMDLVFDLGGLDQLLISQALKPEIIEPHLSMIKENIISVKSHLIEQLNSLGIKIFPTKLDVPIMLVQAEGIENFAPFLARWGVIVEQGQDFIAVHDDVDNSMARIRVPKSIQIANKAFKRIQAAISEAQQNPESCWV